MAVRIRLFQCGCRNRRSFRLVASDSRSPRDGRYLEKLGWYDPHMEQDNCYVSADRVQYWLSVGAQMTETSHSLILRAAPDVIRSYNDHLEQRRLKRIQKRKERNARKKESVLKTGA